MDFAFSEEQEMLKRAARSFLESECPESVVREVERSEKGYHPDLWRKMAELGWLGIIFPEKYGGSGCSLLDVCILCDEMGRALLSSPYLSTVILSGLTILDGGTEDQKSQFLPKIAKGDLIFSLALTEPNASFGPDGITVRAVAKGGDYVIDGTKLFVHDAHIADYFICVARTKEGSAPEEGITLFLVDAKSPGISYTLLKTTAGANKQSEVVFNKVKVSSNNIVGGLNRGWALVTKILQIGAIAVCCEMVGAGQRILELTIDYAKTRIQFDRPIGANQYVQEHCIYLLSYVEGSKLITYQAAWMLSQNLPCDMEVAMAKAWTSDAHEKACWRAHQVLAGMGYATKVGLLPLYSRRSKIAHLYLGDAVYHRKMVAKQIDKWTLERPKGKPLGLWEEGEPPIWP